MMKNQSAPAQLHSRRTTRARMQRQVHGRLEYDLMCPKATSPSRYRQTVYRTRLSQISATVTESMEGSDLHTKFLQIHT